MSLTIFLITYLGIALGKVPGLVIDRVGIALLGAIAMVGFGVVSRPSAVQAIDLPTILLLYSLMVISAQLRLGGFYTWAASRILTLLTRPKAFLLVLMAVSAVLSALLANDIVCFAFTPVLTAALIRSGRSPMPFLLGLAVSSNIGSAATIIGNPQNMLIGQAHDLNLVMDRLAGWGMDLGNSAILTGLTVVLSNLFSNVPAVMLLIPFMDPLDPLQWYTLALSSTFAGNLFVLGSIANLIVIEQASRMGVVISFGEHARVGVPVTLMSLIVLLVWGMI